ncbi:DUF6064 family protein [Brucepastera parasyntrophica]|uniref:DUF6064 family protein n=1 Tax=Brucepastera parasyntrophica TaxID=2880008 RepID=UPI00210A466E|nr:DUF6064 family protein [Brucepastera parasyntrophica]ULQ59267.1 DUF6064 family protein [Brucepastera parasyntrophica]
MNADVFWKIIGEYNTHTAIPQIVFVCVLIFALILSYNGKIQWSGKFVLGLVNLFISIVFFGIFGTQPIQKYFALPLYLCCGFLFLFESIKNRRDTLAKPNTARFILLVLIALYPAISFALGNRFPEMVTYIMPCPVISLSLAVYSGYRRKNIVLLLLLTLWGLTGIKSIFFKAYEDIILLVCGIYGVYLTYREIRNRYFSGKNTSDISKLIKNV